MPELPEVEITRRGIAPRLKNAQMLAVEYSGKALRWPIPRHLAELVKNQTVLSVGRRGKYLLLEFAPGWILVHLGMSGRLCFVLDDAVRGPWDHVDWRFSGTTGSVQRLRLTDPRRFGAVLWHDRQDGPVENHRLLAHLGMEPFAPDFDGGHLYEAFRGRQIAIKQALLAGQAVVGVGNIYAAESLFHAGIRPQKITGRLTRAHCARLATAICRVLLAAIEKGGSSLRDFVASDGKRGYFQQDYFVYARAGMLCRICGAVIRGLKQGQRSSFYCPHCQR